MTYPAVTDEWEVAWNEVADAIQQLEEWVGPVMHFVTELFYYWPDGSHTSLYDLGDLLEELAVHGFALGEFAVGQMDGLGWEGDGGVLELFGGMVRLAQNASGAGSGLVGLALVPRQGGVVIEGGKALMVANAVAFGLALVQAALALFVPVVGAGLSAGRTTLAILAARIGGLAAKDGLLDGMRGLGGGLARRTVTTEALEGAGRNAARRAGAAGLSRGGGETVAGAGTRIAGRNLGGWGVKLRDRPARSPQIDSCLGPQRVAGLAEIGTDPGSIARRLAQAELGRLQQAAFGMQCCGWRRRRWGLVLREVLRGAAHKGCSLVDLSARRTLWRKCEPAVTDGLRCRSHRWGFPWADSRWGSLVDLWHGSKGWGPWYVKHRRWWWAWRVGMVSWRRRSGWWLGSVGRVRSKHGAGRVWTRRGATSHTKPLPWARLGPRQEVWHGRRSSREGG